MEALEVLGIFLSFFAASIGLTAIYLAVAPPRFMAGYIVLSRARWDLNDGEPLNKWAQEWERRHPPFNVELSGDCKSSARTQG